MKDIGKLLPGKTIQSVVLPDDVPADGNPYQVELQFTDGSSVTIVAVDSVEDKGEFETVYGSPDPIPSL